MSQLSCIDPVGVTSTDPSEMRIRWRTLTISLAWATGLSVLFFAVYCSCNAITAGRHDVGRIAMAWERSIPFVPAMIIPYMSIDLLFFVAPFLCKTAQERTNHGKRVIAAIAIAGVCFLLFPLQISFVRPAVSGTFGGIFTFLNGFDRPFNLAPSLHIVFLVLLWGVYVRRMPGGPGWAMRIWLCLIGASTLFTYQHHVIDVVSGAALGLICVGLFPDEGDARPTRHLRIGALYSLASGLCFGLARLEWPWGAAWLWPAVSSALIAAAYLGAGPRVFGKIDGRLRWLNRALFAPHLIGLWLFHRLSIKSPFNKVTPELVIGGRLSNRQTLAMVESGVVAVLDLTAEVSAGQWGANVAYRNIPVLDLIAPTVIQLRDAVDFIEVHRPRGTVYIHCALGYGRSACVAAAYLLILDLTLTVDGAIAAVRKARPKVAISSEAMLALQRFADLRPAPSRCVVRAAESVH